MSEVFVRTDARRACSRGVIGSMMGAYPRGTGLNPFEGNVHFFPSCRQLYLSSFSDTHGECLKCFIRLTRDVPAVVVQSEALWARIPEIQVRIPSRAMGTFSPHTVSSIFRLSLTRFVRLSGGPCRCLASRSRR